MAGPRTWETKSNAMDKTQTRIGRPSLYTTQLWQVSRYEVTTDPLSTQWDCRSGHHQRNDSMRICANRQGGFERNRYMERGKERIREFAKMLIMLLGDH